MNVAMNLGFRQQDLLGEVEEGHLLRIALDATSWVEHIPRWYSDDGELMSDLLETADWEQRDRWMYNETVIEPRLTAGYTMADVPVPKVRLIGSLLSKQFSVPYDSVWMNFYRDQNDSTSWHADRPCLRDECIVSINFASTFQALPNCGD